jgi:hypothetical protein
MPLSESSLTPAGHNKECLSYVFENACMTLACDPLQVMFKATIQGEGGRRTTRTEERMQAMLVQVD